MPGFVAHHGHAQNSELAVILCFNLRYRDVKMVPQPILNAAHYLSFVLEAPGFTYQQADAEGTNNHDQKLQFPVLQRSLHLIDAVSLDQVADLDVIVAGDLQAAFKTFSDLTRVVLEA